jgi:hypothetical protein
MQGIGGAFQVADYVAQQRRIIAGHLRICLAAVSAAIVIIWPVADLPYGDDTAYAHMALNLARTGHLAYNGWEAAVQLLHTYWGALAIRMFGFSFVAVRLSTIPYALGTVAFCYLLVHLAGLQAKAAVFVTLLFGLSPLFLPVAVTYMTDVPGLFFYFASLYFLIRAADSSADGKRYGWLALGVAAGFLGGTGRQVVWFVPLVVLPYLAWARRRNVRFAAASLGGWILTLGGVAAVMSWFKRQPYIEVQLSLFRQLEHAVKRPGWELNMFARFLLMLLFMCLPAALPLALRAWMSTWRGTRTRRIVVGALALAVLLAVLIHPSLASIPWVASTLNWEGINGSAPLPGRPIVLTGPIRAFFALAVYFTCCVLAGELTNIRELAGRVWRAVRDPKGSTFALAAMSLVSIVYFLMVILRGVDVDVFDRYLLPLLPWAATVLLLWFESDNPNAERMLRRAMPFAWALLAVLGAYAILSTQDLWSLARARVVAVRELESAGVPRTAIDAGFEYNAWTELLVSGHLNNRRVINPPGAYRPGLSQTPSVVTMYKLEYAPTLETPPSEFGSVPYFSLLPPFHKQVRIDRVLPALTSDR